MKEVGNDECCFSKRDKLGFDMIHSLNVQAGLGTTRPLRC